MTLPPPPGPQPYGPPSPYDGPAAPSGYGYPPPGYPAPGYPTADYGYPPGFPGGYPQPAPPQVSQPLLGWLLLVAGVLGIVGSVTPWAHVRIVGQSDQVNGMDGDGRLTVVLACVVAITGLVIGLGHGRLWASIVGLVCAALNALIALIDVGSINQEYGPASGISLPDGAITTSFGIWLVVIAGGLGVGFAIAAMVRRAPAPSRLAPRH